MSRVSIFLFAVVVWAVGHHLLAKPGRSHPVGDTVLGVTMNLSAMGVESDTYPSIRANLNFEQHTSLCERSYYNPIYPNSSYHLSAAELSAVQSLLQQTDLKKLKAVYSVGKTDQPTSTVVIRTTSQTFTVQDYGLEGGFPLPELYRLVYKSTTSLTAWRYSVLLYGYFRIPTHNATWDTLEDTSRLFMPTYSLA